MRSSDPGNRSGRITAAIGATMSAKPTPIAPCTKAAIATASATKARAVMIAFVHLLVRPLDRLDHAGGDVLRPRLAAEIGRVETRVRGDALDRLHQALRGG